MSSKEEKDLNPYQIALRDRYIKLLKRGVYDRDYEDVWLYARDHDLTGPPTVVISESDARLSQQ